MTAPGFQFELLHVDAHCGARLGRLTTPRGVIDLPTFMPVGTCGTVKGMTTGMVADAGSQILLGNTYHLHLRPGEDIVESLGGLHKFMDWNGPILTDSGGFQVFSLAKRTVVNESGAKFRSHIDGSEIEITPEISVAIQQRLGSDIAMQFDHVIALPNDRETVRDAMQRSLRWAVRCRDAHSRGDQVQFGIVQGGLDEALRAESARELIQTDFFGYAIGGLSVGEPPAEMYRMIDATAPHMPTDRPRYLMGVGKPQDLVESIRRGVDMFDCVMPTRNGRNAMAFTDDGFLKMRNAVHETDRRPIDAKTVTPLSHHSRGYVRHLFQANEMLAGTLVSMHNIAYYQRIMREAREAIAADAFLDFHAEKMAGWASGKAVS